MPTVRNENAMATNLVASAADEPDDEKPDNQQGGVKTPVPYKGPSSNVEKPAFFTIYKKGQGKWTRLGTVFVAALLGVLTAYNMYHYVLPYLPTSGNGDRKVAQILLAVCVGFLVLFGILTFWITNKPKNVDFLIATDSEMKKVNWTTAGALMGSTRVVILFLFFIAVFLSLADLFFYYLFHFIGVLE
jgi:preprotein translocase SecE subunit